MKQIRLTFKDTHLSVDDDLVLFLIKPLFFIFIYYGMFSRFSGLLGLTGGKTAILMTGMIFAVCCYHFFFINEKQTLSPLFVWCFVFFFVAGLSPMISAFIYNVRLSLVFRFTFEIGIIFIIFFSVYYLVREGLITPKFFVYTIAILGTIAALQFLYSLVGTINLRRLRGLGGLNYIGNSFAVSTIAYVMMLYTGDFKGFKKFAVSFGLFLSLFAMLLTGTRAAMIALVAGLVLYQYFGMKSKQFKKYVFIFLLMLIIPFTILALNVDLTHFFNRYSFADITKMAMIRFNIYAGAVTDLTLIEFLFGRPDLAAFSDGSESAGVRYINPHNVFLSLIRFNGIFSFIIFVTLLFVVFANYLKIFFQNKNIDKYRITEVTILVFLTMSFINVMFSGGKFTRNFYLFIALGYAVGYLDMLRKTTSAKEYLKKLM